MTTMWTRTEADPARPVAAVPDCPTPHPCPARALVLVFLAALAGSLWLYHGLWTDLQGAYLTYAGGDQNLNEWFFADAARNLLELNNPLYSERLNAPDGVNLMANASMLGLSIPLALWTWLLGPEFTYALVLTLGLALSCAAWFWVIRRWVVEHSGAAALAAALCGFGPPVISHGNAHVNFTFAVLVPLIVDRVLRVATGRRVRRDGVVLGLLVAYQIFVGEELLLLGAIGLAMFGITYAITDPRPARTMLEPVRRGLCVGAAVALPLVLGPLLWQFFGPGSYRQVAHGAAPNRPAYFVDFPSRAVAGGDGSANAAVGWTEQNAFFGRPLLCLAVLVAVGLWHLASARAATVTIAAAAVLSLGEQLPLPGTEHAIPGPWRLLAELPIFESMVEARLSMICVPAFAILLALAVERLATNRDRRLRWAGIAAIALALGPLLPTPYPVHTRPEVPAFVEAGAWRDFVRPGRTLVVAPLPGQPGWRTEPMHWAARADRGFALAGGYFAGPDSSGRYGIYGAVPRPSTLLLHEVERSGQPAVADGATRAQFLADLAFWRADAVVIDPSAAEDALRLTIDNLLGRPGQRVGGVLVWRIR